MASAAYWAYRFSIIEDERKSALILALDGLPFNGFEETLDEVVAYVAAEEVNDDFTASLETILASYELSFTRQFIAEQNWNAQWEAAFHPVQVDNFVGVRAEFHPPFADVVHDLIIHPRMAFGTGHHATTFLMMAQMEQLDFADKSVFDYGCGTGILAILAQKLGATAIEAVDIETAATENTLVNMEVNSVSGIDLFTGTLDVVPPTSYDIILANINRNVILASLEALYARIKPGGELLVSGILEQDRDKVSSAASKVGWELRQLEQKDGWLMFYFQRP
ncbi:MAG: 50S ribosomal protein L11 methyltransferase [Bacteroidota bacterium]